MIFYKATRPDGTDFRTGTVRYEVGLTVEHPTSRAFEDMRPNDPGSYLSVSVEPGEVLTGGSWPCRLFRVEPWGEVVARTDGVYSFKRGCLAVRVLEELPAHVALGPNGEAVAALIERAGRLTDDEIKRLRAAWDAAWTAAGTAAGDAAWGAAWGAAWDAAWDAAWTAAGGAAGGAAWTAARDAAWDAAGGAAWDAAGALLVRGLISAEHFQLLYGPWASVMEGGEA